MNYKKSTIIAWGITILITLLSLILFVSGCIYENHYGLGSVHHDKIWMEDSIITLYGLWAISIFVSLIVTIKNET